MGRREAETERAAEVGRLRLRELWKRGRPRLGELQEGGMPKQREMKWHILLWRGAAQNRIVFYNTLQNGRV